MPARLADPLESAYQPVLDAPGVAPPTPLRPMVAVLPFGAPGDDEALRRLGGQIADVLREQLARDPAMRAILADSDFLAAAPPHAVELICRELRIGYLIGGNCHPQGQGESLYIELTDTREWHVHWAHFYRGQARALLDGEGELMSQLAGVLRRALLDSRSR